jgi:hypothetical protein
MKTDVLKKLYKGADATGRAGFRDMAGDDETLLKALDEIDDEENEDYEDDDEGVSKSLDTSELDRLAQRLVQRASLLPTKGAEDFAIQDEGDGLSKGLDGQAVDLTASFESIASAINDLTQQVSRVLASNATLAKGLAALTKHEQERGVTRGYLRNCVRGEATKAIEESAIGGLAKSLNQPRAPRGATTTPSQVLPDSGIQSGLGGNAAARLQDAFAKTLGKNDALAREIAKAQSAVRNGGAISEQQLTFIEAEAQKVALGI